ncbi:tight adherence protein C [Paraburkholderia sp. GAS41]|jgi:tight adherence protein C|uniref:type II secretion system F family protein n=1 Tax=Paraburkholderia sp. GAS41 TaxID=3035134 RepID=UPI003D1CBCBC
MRADRVAALALALAAVALLLLAALVIAKLAATRRRERTLSNALNERAQQNAARTAAGASVRRSDAGAGEQVPKLAPATGLKALVERFAHTGIRWLDTPLGRQLVAVEDRRMLEQCGFVDTRARGLFLFARIGLATCLPLLAGTLAGGHLAGEQYFALLIGTMIAGFMLPKFFIQRRAARRRRGVVDELPMLVDLLRLLQGVGLSIDQSLQVMVSDFSGVLPVLSSELEIAQRHFATGRTREQSLQRLASSYGNEDLRAIVRLLVQVDRHGGAVQEPLKQFCERLREARRATLRERIGRLAVKMTGVMIMTLLPALLIVTAGPGVLSITNSLHATKR